MEKGKIAFEISENDYKHVKRFQKQHEKCFGGITGEQFEYSFIPNGLGTAILVKCSCGQILRLGDSLDYDSREYDEYENRVLTEDDHKNKRFEMAVSNILGIKSPVLFRIGFQMEQNVDVILGVALAISGFVDERFSRCILWKYSQKEDGRMNNNYEGLDDAEKVAVFYKYFEEHVREEVLKYDCENDAILSVVGAKRYP